MSLFYVTTYVKYVNRKNNYIYTELFKYLGI